MVNLSLLGPFQADIDDQPVQSFKAQKAKALLIYLAVEAHHTHQRESLMTMLWPGFALQSAQQNLRQTVYLLRQSLPVKEDAPDPLLVDRFTMSWNPDFPLSLDIAQFEDLADSPELTDRHQAVDLYRGHFLKDFYLPDSEPFEEWAANKRAYYFNTAQDLMDGLTADFIAENNWSNAENIVRRLLNLDKFRESAHRQLIEVLARSGRRQEAIRHYNTLRTLLKDEFGLDPEPETVSLIDAIHDGKLEHTAPSSSVTTLTSRRPAASIQPNHNLPHSLDNFIGRKKEIDQIESLVSSHRVVMLTGAAGIGKTKLSLKVGRNLIHAFPEGVWLVELAPINDPDLIPKAIASAMGLSESSGRPVEQVILDVLRENHCLLIFDNCEHLIDQAAQYVETILHKAPNVKILASSLEPLNIPGEIQYPVPPLSKPEIADASNLKDWQQYEAVQLFASRAQAIVPEFQITETNIDSVVQICQQIDGIPLAIELAAARVSVLSVADIATRMNDRFNLLVGGSRTAVPRHKTLRGMMEWSWELLSAAEQDLLQRLSVFAGETNLPAVEAVCGGEGVENLDILNLMTQLVNKSLVISERRPDRGLRYRLLETIRQYGQEQLQAAGKLEHYRDRHLAHYVQLGEEAEPKLVVPEQASWFRRLRADMDNLRAALLWAREKDPLSGIKLITSLWRFLGYGYMVEYEQMLDHLLTQAEDNLPYDLRAKAFLVQSKFNTWPIVNMKKARQLGKKSLRIYQELNDQQGIATCLGVIGWTYFYSDPKEYENLVRQGMEIFRTIGDKLGLAETLYFLGVIMESKHPEKAKDLNLESLKMFREIGNLVGMLEVLRNTARLSIFLGEFESARSYIQECLEIHEKLGQQGGAHTLETLGHLYLSTEDYTSALEALEKSLTLSKRNGELTLYSWTMVRKGYVLLRMGELEQARETMLSSIQPFLDKKILVGLAYILEGLASLYVVLKQVERATQLIGWTDKIREQIGDPRAPIEQDDVNKDIKAIIEMIGKEAYSVAHDEGQALSTKQAIALATSNS